MYIPFNQLSNQSKVWIYASEKRLTAEQCALISIELKYFTDVWQAHGVDLKASFLIQQNHFIIIGVDETHHAPSGCSIDKSVQVIKSIESKLNIDLMNRMIVYFLSNNQVESIRANDISKSIKDGVINIDSQIFDNTITSMESYQKAWLKPAKETWLNRYFVYV
jgi:hypothetical protein